MNGIIPLWKERGMTSHDCVFKLRKILHTKKVGHTGTLDPEVEGVLPICIGRATKLAEYVTDEGKVYVAEITLGKSTTTEDATGETVETKDIAEISAEELQAALTKLTGKITQIPPMFSAVKVNGKKLYEYARAGIEVERPSRQVDIYSLVRLDGVSPLTESNPTFKLEISCGKGTYIRTLAVMIGELLGYPAHMSKLARTRSGFFKKEDCLTLAEIDEKMQANDTDFLYPLEKGIESMAKLEIDEEIHAKVLNGVLLPKSLFQTVENEPRVALIFQEKLTAIYKPHPEKKDLFKPEKVIELQQA
ncbi:tRNA pseudouridine(55) synthase TruB [Listeria innocua]|uniref:tRNA pseudouridine synthase B n=1 Tax=Listeria innocua ATCC 33091 TaxID=1002366 RepID=A0AB72Z8W0_LISIO|nr:tRNA pseudouridine(55) synthase TruB [Listeria innocua]EAD5681356.1 tRNA pseudouridine(55) synthase TruB [Listeria innocua]EAF5650996.1 tRNA pseudouridine(55) synthase TruB [Listeria innocua]EAG8538082.1 tRNA pseudouridine(55) synthase TruB [Listeria innocua]EDO1153823.1 tRNA pseudouridine(55) synthase TruB [Listeria innocua]EED2357592.1 tRNA pseudouridine(55) synthase TruB [Listeria innocua]